MQGAKLSAGVWASSPIVYLRVQGAQLPAGGLGRVAPYSSAVPQARNALGIFRHVVPGTEKKSGLIKERHLNLLLPDT